MGTRATYIDIPTGSEKIVNCYFCLEFFVGLCKEFIRLFYKSLVWSAYFSLFKR